MPPVSKKLHPSNRRADIGSRGEYVAADFLRRLGYSIIVRNIRTAAGELDIVARDGNTLVFVEVKTRTGITYGEPETAVTPIKLRHITASALLFGSLHPELPDAYRIDVIAVLMEHESGRILDVRHEKNVTV